MRTPPAAKRRSSDRQQSTLSDYVETEAAANDDEEEDEDDANASDVDEHGNISNLINRFRGGGQRCFLRPPVRLILLGRRLTAELLHRQHFIFPLHPYL